MVIGQIPVSGRSTCVCVKGRVPHTVGQVPTHVPRNKTVVLPTLLAPVRIVVEEVVGDTHHLRECRREGLCVTYVAAANLVDAARGVRPPLFRREQQLIRLCAWVRGIQPKHVLHLIRLVVHMVELVVPEQTPKGVLYTLVGIAHLLSEIVHNVTESGESVRLWMVPWSKLGVIKRISRVVRVHRCPESDVAKLGEHGPESILKWLDTSVQRIAFALDWPLPQPVIRGPYHDTIGQPRASDRIRHPLDKLGILGDPHVKLCIRQRKRPAWTSPVCAPTADREPA